MHILEIEDIDDAIAKIQPVMVTNEQYYWHIYNEGKTLVVIFQDKVFRLDPADKTTWKNAQDYGAKKLHIIAEQLDFYPTSFADEPEWLAGKE